MKTLLVLGLPGVGKTTLLERWQAQSGLPFTHFTVEQPERVFVERDLVLNRDGAYVPTGLNYEAELNQPRLPIIDVSCVCEMDQWTDLISAVETRAASVLPSDEQAEVFTVITVVDASSILKLAREFVALTDKSNAPEERFVHGTMGSLLQGIFLADLVVLNKCDLVSNEERDRAEQLIRHFHAGVPVIKTRFADVPWEMVSALPEPVQSRAEARRKWDEFQQANPSKCGDPVLTDFVYRARRPFHPQRFESLVRHLLHPSICLRGYFWLATRMDWAGYLSGTFAAVKIYGIGHWLASRPETEWSQAMRQDPRRRALWDPFGGDRRQELWFTGFPGFLNGLRAQLDAALLNDEEMKAGPEAWAQISDPWPAWRFGDPHHHHDHEPAHAESGLDAKHEHHHGHDEHGHCCGHYHGPDQKHEHTQPTTSHEHS